MFFEERLALSDPSDLILRWCCIIRQFTLRNTREPTQLRDNVQRQNYLGTKH